MGRVLLYVGLAILFFGQGPILLLGKLDTSNLTEYVLLTLLAGVSFLPGIVLTLFGALACFHNFLKDRLPY